MPQREIIHEHAGITTFYRSPHIQVDEVPEGSVAVIGVPIDSWVLSRNGQRQGPRAIREASMYLAGYYGLQPEPVGYVDVTTGKVWTIPDEPRIFDVGDVRIVQQDADAQIEAIVDPVSRIVERGAFPVLLGGDHFIPYPGYLGLVRGLKQRHENVKVGFFNLDGHFDLWDEFKDLGRMNHGTFARRIAEDESVGNMVWWGINGNNVLQPDQLELCHARGFVGYRVQTIRRRGITETMREGLERAADGATHVYVTFDIDVTDGAYAPGTNSMTYGALTSGEVLEAISVIPEFDVVAAFDVAEMLPRYDSGGGRTARLACHAILSVVQDRVLDSEQRYDQSVMDAVLPS
jgi:agmatinase